MSLILNIDTAVQSASVCLADGETFLGTAVNPSERDAAAWLHTAVQTLMVDKGLRLQELSAVAVSAGPGSYTGLRVGMAAAKGLCYALNIPLISVPTLQMMAAAVTAQADELRCPMIDARRMEVFAALYDKELNEMMPAKNLVLEQGCFDDWLQDHDIVFFGNGSEKAKPVLPGRRTRFIEATATAESMVLLAHQRFVQGRFSNLAYAEPFYGKDFHSPPPKKNV